MTHPAIIAWLVDAGSLIALALFVACVVYGALLLLAPGATLRVSATLNRRYSSRRALRPFEVPRSTERFFYRHHQLTGWLLLAGVSVFFLLYGLGYPRDTVLAAFAREFDRTLSATVIEALEGFLLVANVLIGVFAVIMIIRPSLIKPFETWANRWISTRRALRGAERSREPVDALFSRRPRLGGLLILLGAGYVAFSLVVAMA